jgi:hypothetical protein
VRLFECPNDEMCRILTVLTLITLVSLIGCAELLGTAPVSSNGQLSAPTPTPTALPKLKAAPYEPIL